MGEDFRWVNFDRRESLLPEDFKEPSGASQTKHRGSLLLSALQEMVSHEWENSHIAFVGDEWNVPEDTHIPAFTFIKNIMEAAGYKYIIDFIWDCINVSGKFKAAEDEVREEIENYLSFPSLPNEYGINPENPYQGLFERDGVWFEYTVNETKKISYSISKTHFFLENEPDDYAAVPLPYLMGYGRTLKLGPWFGDIVSFRNEIGDDIQLADSIYLYRQNRISPKIIF